MSKKFKNPEILAEILDTMRKELIGALTTAQLTNDNSIPNAVDLIRPAFNKFEKEDLVNAFIIFSLNVAVDGIAPADSQNTGKINEESILLSKSGQA